MAAKMIKWLNFGCKAVRIMILVKESIYAGGCVMRHFMLKIFKMASKMATGRITVAYFFLLGQIG